MALLTWPWRSTSVARSLQRPLEASPSGACSSSLVEARAPAGRPGVDPERPDPRWALICPEVDPHAVDLDPPAAVTGHRPAAAGRDRCERAAPGHELDLPVGEERLAHLEPDATDEPQVLGYPPASLLDVVDRDVLQEPRDRVEPDASGLIHVGEAHFAARPERPPHGWDG